MKPGIPAEMEGVAPARSVRIPGPRQARHQASVSIELRQIVEQQGNHLTGWYIGGQSRVQRSRIVCKKVVQARAIAAVDAADQDRGSEAEKESVHRSLGRMAEDSRATRRFGVGTTPSAAPLALTLA